MKHLFALILLLMANAAFAKTTVVEMESSANRRIPVTIVTPDKGKVKGIILFSHGAFSAPGKYAELTGPWAKSGYAIVAPLHADSSDWTGVKPAMKDQTAWRIADMQAAIANLAHFAKEAQFKADKARLIAAGHSFGALIAMMLDEPRIISVMAFSPPGPLPGLNIPVVSRPMLTITGTADTNPQIAPDWRVHLTAHQQATGRKWAYVGADADHYFGGIYGRPELPGPKQSAPFDEALALSIRFLDGKGRLKKFEAKAGAFSAD